MAAEELILHEGFETEGDGDRYTLIGGFDDGGDNYIARRQVFQAGTPVYGGTLEGEWMMGFQDLDFAPIDERSNGHLYDEEDMGVRQGRLKFENIDVSGYGNLRIEMAAANMGGNEPNDDLYIRVRFDGGDWTEIGGFKSNSSNYNPSYYVGPRDTVILANNPNRLFRFFSDWSWDIPMHGQSMELQITVEGNAGDEDHHIDNIRIYGDPTVPTVNAGFDNGDVTEPESGGVANTLTVTLDQPAPAGGVTFALEPLDQRSANSLNLPSNTITVPAGETSATLAAEVIQDNQYTGTKTVDLYVRAEGYSESFARVMVTDVTERPNVVITEILNVVPGLDRADLFGDANGDGEYHNARDQFIEIVNFEDYPVDLSGWRIGDDLADRHLIPDGTILQPNQALVVFGGGIPRGNFGGAIVQVATAGGNGLGWNIASREETPYLNAQFGAPVDYVFVPPQRDDFLAISEDPDQVPEGHAGYRVSASVHRLTKGPAEPGAILDAPANMHSLIDGAEERLFSPGTWFDGTPYFEKENEITLTIDNEVISEADGANAATGSIRLETAAPAGGIGITLETNGVIEDGNGGFSPDEIDLDSLVVTVPAGALEATFRIGAVNDGILDGDQIVSIRAHAGHYVISGYAELTVTDVAEDGFNVVINEIMVDVEDDGFDINGDGITNDGLGDQFVEVVNKGDTMVNLSGWKLEWDTGGTFAVPRTITVFPKGTWLPAGGSIVVFGSVTEESVLDPEFGGAIVQQAHNADGSIKPNGVDLQITTGFDMKLYNEHGYVVDLIEEAPYDVVSQGSSATWGINPETGETALVPHFDINLVSYSPGRDTDGNPFAGNGWTRMPEVFSEVNAGFKSGWFADPSFGWIFTGAFAESHSWDLPWVFLDDTGDYWYVYEESVSNGFMWAYDYAVGGWLYTGYGLYPWVWSDVQGDWVNQSE